MGEQLSEANHELATRLCLMPVMIEGRVAFNDLEILNRLLDAARSEGPHPESGEWAPIVQCPTDGVQRWLRLPDGSEVRGCFINPPGRWRVWTAAFEMPGIAPEPRGGVQQPAMPYTTQVYRNLPDGMFPTHFKRDRAASPPLEGAGRPDVLHHHDRHPWAQSGDQPERLWMLVFSDADQGVMTWRGDDAEKEAREAYARYQVTWTCSLLATVEARPSASKWEALPVVSEEMVEAAKANIAANRLRIPLHLHRDIDALVSALSLPRPASDKGEGADVWARIGADDRLKRARQRLSLHELRMIVDHARARPSPGVGREEVAHDATVTNLVSMAWLKGYDRGRFGPASKHGNYSDEVPKLAAQVLSLLSRGEG